MINDCLVEPPKVARAECISAVWLTMPKDGHHECCGFALQSLAYERSYDVEEHYDDSTGDDYDIDTLQTAGAP